LLNDKLKERFDRASLESWYLQYPSPFDSVRFLIKALPGKPGTFVAWSLALAYSFIVAFLPIGLSYAIVRTANFPVSLKYPWLITNTMLNFCVMVGITGALVQRHRAERRIQSRTRSLSELTRKLQELAAELQEHKRTATQITQSEGVAQRSQQDADEN